MIAVCPGSFDPVTLGHVDIFERAARHFDQVIALVTGNPQKTSGWFSIDERVDLIRAAVSHVPNVTVDWHAGLLVDYTTQVGASVIVKGLRSSLDYEYELPQAQQNRRMSGVDTFFLLTDPRYGHISSSLTKEVAALGGPIDGLLPPAAEAAVRDYLERDKDATGSRAE